MSSIALHGVSRAFGPECQPLWAVRDVTFTFQAGRMYGIHGVSGSGKSTLLNLMACLDIPTEGEVVVDDVVASALDDDARADLRLGRIGVVFQDHNLIEEFTAIENVTLPLEVATGRRASNTHAAGQAALQRVGLVALAHRHPSQMSGGQRQRVGIARAVIGERTILLADEPSGALDSATSREVFQLLRQVSDAGSLVIVATHDPLVAEVADELLEMVDGALRVGQVVPAP